MKSMINRSEQYHLKIFLLFCVTVILIVSALTFSLYYNYKNSASNIAQAYTLEELSQISYNTNIMLESTKSTLIQYSSDPFVLQLMNYTDLDSLQTSELLRKIPSFNTPYACLIYIYNRNAGKVYYSGREYSIDTFPDSNIINSLENNKIKKLSPITRILPDNSLFILDNHQGGEVFTLVYYNSNSTGIYNAIILNVSPQWLRNTIDSMNINSSDQIIITNSDGNIVLDNENYLYQQNIRNVPALENIFENNTKSGYIYAKINHEKYLVSYVTADITNWKYIRLTPYKQIEAKFRKDVLITFLVSIAVLLMALLISLLFSKSIYRTFTKKLNEIEKKLRAEKNTGYEKKQKFLRDIIEKKNDSKILKNELQKFGIPFNIDERFLLVLFKPDSYMDFCKNFSSSDKELFTYGFMNIVNEIVSAYFKIESVNMGNGFVCSILNMSFNDYQDAMTNTEELVKYIQIDIIKYLGISYSAVIGEVLEEISEIPTSLSECMNAMKYKIFYSDKSIIYTSAVNKIEKKETEFQFKKIYNLTNSLLLGKKDEALRCFEDIVEETRQFSLTYFQATVMQIVMTIKIELEKNPDLNGKIEYVGILDMVSNIADFESLDILKQKFYEFFENILSVIVNLRYNTKNNDKYGELLNNINRFVKEKYKNPNLNTVMIAENAGISTGYLRRLYKNITGESIEGFINNYRLKIAGDYLTNTEESINEIAEQTGFGNINYFYTLFKKSYGVTPYEYRSIKASHK